MGAEVYHIGSPTGQPGSDFQSVRSHSTQSYSHPTTSPVSFGPVGSPSVSGSAVPGGAMSSPGRMSDIEGTSFCAGLPPLSSGGVQRPYDFWRRIWRNPDSTDEFWRGFRKSSKSTRTSFV